jgi:hypothetical protein
MIGFEGPHIQAKKVQLFTNNEVSLDEQIVDIAAIHGVEAALKKQMSENGYVVESISVFNYQLLRTEA